MATKNGWEVGQAILLLLLLLFVALSPTLVSGDPAGATITSASSEIAPNRTAASRADARSTINTLVLDVLQPDQHWKAYVGNVTGKLTLDDTANFTIYDWDLTTITGEVYASRFGNLTWSSISCASASLVVNESDFHNMTDSDADDINSTFNWSTHKQFTVATTTINANTCNSTVTYANDTRQTPTAAAPFQEILIMDDTNDYLVYMTSIENNVQGFDNQSYDFQMIVAESHVKASPTTYYFYVELGS